MSTPYLGPTGIYERKIDLKLRHRLSKHLSGQWFIKGPIPGVWLSQASKISFRALRVGLALWYLVGMKKSQTVRPTRTVWERFGLNSQAGLRGLAALENAGLVQIERSSGKSPTVTICKFQPKEIDPNVY